MQSDMKKILVKVTDGKSIRYAHFAYVPSEIYNRFSRVLDAQGACMNEKIEQWAEGDYGTEFSSISTPKKMFCLKSRIRAQFEATLDVQKPALGYCVTTGFINLWITNHMIKEMSNGLHNRS